MQQLSEDVEANPHRYEVWTINNAAEQVPLSNSKRLERLFNR
jgi:hypothetical protein